MRSVCRRFAQQPMEISVDDESKLTLHGLRQHFVQLTEKQKNKNLCDLMDKLDFSQVVIFVKSIQRAKGLNKLLNDAGFPSVAVYGGKAHRGGLSQEERLDAYTQFKEYKKRILVA